MNSVKSRKRFMLLAGAVIVSGLVLIVWQQIRPSNFHGISVGIDGDRFKASLSLANNEIKARCVSRNGGSSDLLLPSLTKAYWNEPNIQVNEYTGNLEYRLAKLLVAVYDTSQHRFVTVPGR